MDSLIFLFSVKNKYRFSDTKFYAVAQGFSQHFYRPKDLRYFCLNIGYEIFFYLAQSMHKMCITQSIGINKNAWGL